LIVTIGLASSLTLTGCDSGGAPTEQAQKSREAAKSSMEYMKKQLAASRGASKPQSKQTRKSP
jgi:hypothetical protein